MTATAAQLERLILAIDGVRECSVKLELFDATFPDYHEVRHAGGFASQVIGVMNANTEIPYRVTSEP